MKKLELYIHIPFCVQKCAYCDFLSMPSESTVRIAYIRKLKEEIRYRAAEYSDSEISSVFFGGGTPSILHSQQILDIITTLRECFYILPEAEITIECNPGTLTTEKLETYRKAGINRLSLGLQSANAKELSLLGRIHSYGDFLESFDCARKHGFDNINVDLMSALPGQTLKTWEQTLKKVVMLKPEHISAYSLIIEEGTPFYKLYSYDDETRKKGEKPLFLPSEEEERRMYHFTQEYLEKKGYRRYEISNYAKPGKECVHNIGYWDRTDYLGLGLGASSMVENKRFSNIEVLTEYLKWDFTYNSVQELSHKDQMEEFMFLGLRMMKGISKAEFLKLFSIPVDSVYGPILKKLEQQGLLVNEDRRIFLTDAGIDVSNYVFTEFLQDE